MAKSNKIYDNAGNLIEWRRSDGTVGRRAYDARSRPLFYDNGRGWVEQWAYDARGNKLSHTTPHSTSTWTYNDDNNVLVEDSSRWGC
jgi:YD repeat-containing protein